VYKPVFTRPPQSWRDWWSAVRAFTAGWYGIAAGEVHGYDREVGRLGRQLGMPLSPSIHEWAAFATDLQHAGIFGRAFNGDRFTLGWDSDMQAVTLLTLLEGDVCWAVHQRHLGRDDPPVDCWQEARTHLRSWEWWRGFAPTTSHFALQYLIAHLPYPGNPAAGGFTTTVPPAPEIAGQLRSIGRTSIDLGGEVFIEDDDLIVLAGKSVWAPPGEETGTITVRAAIGATRTGSIPQLLVDLARHGGWTHGVFTDPRHR
jgi:hypothetical protein